MGAEVMGYAVKFCEVSIRSNGNIRKVSGDDANGACLRYAERIAHQIDFEPYEEGGLTEAVAYVDIHKDVAYITMMCNGRSDHIYVEEEFTTK